MRFYTHGRNLLHARVPWQTSVPGGERPSGRPWELPEWAERWEISQRRVQALLTDAPLADDGPAGQEQHLFGLGTARTLADWTQYSGIDYTKQTVVIGVNYYCRSPVASPEDVTEHSVIPS